MSVEITKTEALAAPRASVVGSREASRGTLAAFLAPALILYAAFIFYPVLRTFYNSLHTVGPLNVATFVGLHNFTEPLTHDRTFWRAVGNTVTFTLVGTVLDVLGGLLLALCLFARPPFARTMRVIWFTPVLMSYVVVGIVWVWLYDYDWGLINQVVREGSVLDAALTLAARVTVNAPLSVQASKRIACGADDGVITDEEPKWARILTELRTVMRSEDAKEGPLAFAQKRPPVWKAR